MAGNTGSFTKPKRATLTGRNQRAKGFNIEFEPKLVKLSQRFNNITDHMGKLDIPHREISFMLLAWVLGNFKTEGGNVGNWQEFALGGRRLPSGAIDTSAKLLQDTGRLRASFTPFHNNKIAGIGSVLPYSKKHEFGDPKEALPKRRMLPKLPDVRVKIKEIFDDHVRVALKKT